MNKQRMMINQVTTVNFFYIFILGKDKCPMCIKEKVMKIGAIINLRQTNPGHNKC